MKGYQPITCLTINQDDSMIMLGRADKRILFLQAQTGKVLASIAQHDDGIETVAFSTSMPYAASGGIDGKIIIYDLTNMQVRHTVTANEEAVCHKNTHHNS